MGAGSAQSLRRVVALGAVVMFLAVLELPSEPAATTGPGNPTVGDGARTLNRTELSNNESSLIRLSGLRNNVVTASVSPAAGEVIECATTDDGDLRFTANGTSPTNTSATVKSLNCATPNPNGAQIYTATIAPADLVNAPVNAIVAFSFSVDMVPTGAYSDTNGGAFFKYRLDRSLPNITNKVPQNVTGASVLDPVTSNNRTVISFTIADNGLEAQLNQSSIKMTVDGVDRTTVFGCGAVDAWTVNCLFDYSLAATQMNFTGTTGWSEANHSILIDVNDTTVNGANPATKNFTFRIDKTPPVVSNITGTILSGVNGTGGNLSTTGLGGRINVTASVADPNLDRNSNSSVFAILFNSSLGLTSPPTPMTFNSTSGTWRTNASTVPFAWIQAAPFNVSVRVQATDLGGNLGQADTAAPVFRVDPVPPAITLPTPTEFRPKGDYQVVATIVEQETGLKNGTVKLLFNASGAAFTAGTPTLPKEENNTYFAQAMAAGVNSTFTGTIPSVNHGGAVVFKVVAQDNATNNGTSSLFGFIVDDVKPVIAHDGATPTFLGAPPFELRFNITDPDSGLFLSGLSFSWRIGTGTVSNATLDQEGTSDIFVATIEEADVDEGDPFRFWVAAPDNAGNVGTFGTAAAPKVAVIDLTPPEMDINAPASAEGPTFTLEWSGTDPPLATGGAGSGVASYTLQARTLLDGEPLSDWITFADNITTTSMEACVETGFTYEFRGFATDRAGNSGDLPDNAMDATDVEGGESCEETLQVDIVSPVAGITVDGLDGAGTLEVAWVATANRTLTPDSSLLIDILFSPDNGLTFEPVALGAGEGLSVDLPNTGSFDLPLSNVPSCTQCFVQVVASTPTNVSDTSTSGRFRITNGVETADLDGNGLADEWEVRYLGRLGLADPDADDDGDGLSNRAESQAGSDPSVADTDGDGASDRIEVKFGTDPVDPNSVPTEEQMRETQFTDFYWGVPALFAIVAIIFFIGLARRW